MRRVEGLGAPLTITIDRWGIPHIAAASIEDAYFGQGYAAATLRLWQLDLAHRRGLGRLAAAFGSEFVPFDRAARLVQFRGNLDDEWQRLAPRVNSIATAFAAGINARVTEVTTDRTMLPVEFRTLDMLPDRWMAEDLLRVRHSGSPNVRGEVRRAMLACRGALDLDALVHPLEPDWPLTIPKGLDPCRVTRDDLAVYDLLSAPLPFAKALRSMRSGELELPAIISDIDARQGSNAWVIAPSRSSTGRPILANDPHLPFSIPSPRMITHLTAPGLNVIGAGPVWRPGVQFGHNQRIAFGRTDFQIDQEDLYVLDLDAKGATYRGPKGAVSIERVRETIEVKGGLPVDVELAFTPLGPIISESRERRHAIVLRAAWLEPGAAVNLEYVPKTMATNWDEFRTAICYAVWGTNYMYADVDGNIGWQSAGRVPVRPNHDGLLPVPASGDYPWSGTLPLEKMPGEFNPPRGYIASANQMPFPEDWPIAERRISFEWIANDRFRRADELLAKSYVHSPEASWRMQMDVVSRRADALVALLVGRVLEGEAAEAAKQLLAWDRRIDAGSRAAALYEAWWTELQRLVRPLLVPVAHRDIIVTLHPHVVLRALQSPDSRFGTDPASARDRLLADALAGAKRIIAQKSAGQAAPLTWGEWHEVTLHHQFERLLPPEVGDVAGVQGIGSGGDGSTLMARWWVGPEKAQSSGGAMFRAVVDVGNWEAARAISGPGQSGEPANPHYRDLYAPWLAGESIPLSFAPDAVAAVAETTITLEPMPR